MSRLPPLASIAICTALLAGAAHAADLVRHSLLGGSKFPIARAVEVPAGTAVFFHSGTTPAPGDPKAPVGTAEQPNLPARSTVQVAALVQPGMLVEVEVQLAKAGK